MARILPGEVVESERLLWSGDRAKLGSGERQGHSIWQNVVAGVEGIGGIAFGDYGLAFRLGTVALVFILCDSDKDIQTGNCARQSQGGEEAK